jgi:hypothetical protein
MGNDVCIRQSDSKTCDILYCRGLVRLIVSTEMPTTYFKMSPLPRRLCIPNLIIFLKSIISDGTIKIKREITRRTAWISRPVATTVLLTFLFIWYEKFYWKKKFCVSYFMLDIISKLRFVVMFVVSKNLCIVTMHSCISFITLSLYKISHASFQFYCTKRQIIHSQGHHVT